MFYKLKKTKIIMTTNQPKVTSAGPEPRGRVFMRLRGLIRKEFLQVLRDPSSLGIAFVLPVILLLLFGYGVSLDAEHVPIALVVDKPTAETSSLCGAFGQSFYFDPVYLHGMNEALQALASHRVDAVVYLREDFSRKLWSPGRASIQLILNGVDANTARIISGYVEGVYGNWLEDKADENNRTLNIPVRIKQRVWFNSELRSRNFLVPGLIAVIMTLIGALLTALLMAREWERGTMEALMVTPVTIREILIGKIVPYFILGMGGMALSVVMAVWQFDVPLRGSIWVLLLGTSLFLLTALGMGLLISTLARNQFVAGQVAIITTFLPAFILSGFIFDIGSMPAVIRAITYLIPARYFVAILQTVFMAGDVWPVILPNALALMVMAMGFIGLTRKKTYKRLD
jgi:ABC-2 type transport system permease protein